MKKLIVTLILIAGSVLQGAEQKVTDSKTVKFVEYFQEKVTLSGHEDRVNSVSWSRDGFLASGSQDGTVKLWDPNGTLLASGSGDKTIKLWDPRIARCLETLKGCSGGVNSVSSSPDGMLLASGSHKDINLLRAKLISGTLNSDFNTIKIWNPRSAKCTHLLKGHPVAIVSVDWSSDGRRLISTDQGGYIKIWDPYTTECTCTLKKSCCTRLSWSPESTQFAS